MVWNPFAEIKESVLNKAEGTSDAGRTRLACGQAVKP
jgi:hypothetical protein